MLEQHGTYQYMGGDGNFCWFLGIVEDIHDPLRAGRVRVRCFGYHSKDKQFVKTEHLPWAPVVSPTTSASVSGIGSTPHNLVHGSQVVGFFQDGNSAQFPIIVGSIPSIPKEASNPEMGFNDPDGVYPREDRIGNPDVNILSGLSHGTSPYRISRTNDVEIQGEIQSASGETWTEKDTDADPSYPDNHVIETKSGHLIEIDDTDGIERIHVRHKKGTYFEIHADGSVSKKVKGTEQQIISGDENILVEGSVRINTNDKADLVIQDKVHVKVNAGDVVIEVLEGNADISVKGNANLNIEGNMNTSVEGDMTTNVKGDSITNVDGEWKAIAKGKARLNGSRVDLN